jgi:hypothetical protein
MVCSLCFGKEIKRLGVSVFQDGVSGKQVNCFDFAVGIPKAQFQLIGICIFGLLLEGNRTIQKLNEIFIQNEFCVFIFTWRKSVNNYWFIES